MIFKLSLKCRTLQTNLSQILIKSPAVQTNVVGYKCTYGISPTNDRNRTI